MLNLFTYQEWPTQLRVRVTPKAKSERILQVTDTDGRVVYKVYVTEPAEEGKANKAVIALLAKSLGLPKSALSIIRGHIHRDKIIALDPEAIPKKPR